VDVYVLEVFCAFYPFAGTACTVDPLLILRPVPAVSAGPATGRLRYPIYLPPEHRRRWRSPRKNVSVATPRTLRWIPGYHRTPHYRAHSRTATAPRWLFTAHHALPFWLRLDCRRKFPLPPYLQVAAPFPLYGTFCLLPPPYCLRLPFVTRCYPRCRQRHTHLPCRPYRFPCSVTYLPLDTHVYRPVTCRCRAGATCGRYVPTRHSLPEHCCLYVCLQRSAGWYCSATYGLRTTLPHLAVTAYRCRVYLPFATCRFLDLLVTLPIYLACRYPLELRLRGHAPIYCF